jgi:hypothetical protein
VYRVKEIFVVFLKENNEDFWEPGQPRVRARHAERQIAGVHMQSFNVDTGVHTESRYHGWTRRRPRGVQIGRPYLFETIRNPTVSD